MASRIDYSQNRKLYVGTIAEVAVADGNAIIAGNVGIGTTSPDFKLDVAGDVRIEGDSGLYFGDTGTSPKWGMASTGLDLLINNSTTNGDVVFLNDGDITFVNGGNVGIGATNPLVKLQVYGNPMPAAADAASVEDMLTLYRNGSSSVWAGGASLSLGRYSAGGSSPKSRLDFKLKAAAGSNTALPELTVMTMNSDGRVGIGTTSPGAKLEVSNGSSGFAGSYNGRTAAVFGGSNSAGTTISIMSPSTGYSGLFFGDENNEAEGQIQYDHSASAFRFLNGGGNERMRISSGGNVGIGTTNPAQSNLVLSPSAQSADVDGITVVYNPDGATNRVRSQLKIDSFSGVLELTSSADTIATYITAGGDSFFNAGNVGIGTASPQSTRKLDVAGHIQGSQNLYLGVVGTNLPTNSIEIGAGRTGNGYAYMDLTGDATYSDYGLRIIRNNTGANASSQIIHRGTGDFSITTTESADILLIPNSGNVGIGTTSPFSKLEVVDTNRAPSLTFNAAAAFSISTNATDQLVFGQNTVGPYNYWLQTRTASGAALKLAINPLGGNVGIGTTSPETPLHVLSNTTDNASTMLVQNGSTGDASIKFNVSGDTYSIGIDNSDGDKFKLSYGAVGTNDRIVVDSLGNVGIGTTSPLDPLNVQSTGASDYAFRIFRSTSATQGLAGFYEGSANQGQLYLLKGNNTAGVGLNSDGDSYLNGGNVGIGTTSPDTKLVIEDVTKSLTGNVAGTAQGTLSLVSSDASGIDVGASMVFGGNYTTGSNTKIAYAAITGRKELATSGNADGYLAFYTWLSAGMTEKMRIDRIGNVGIGTNNPTTNYSKVLQINASGNGSTLRLTDAGSGSSVGSGLELLQYGTGSYIINRESGPMNFWTSSSQKMTILANGNVGIGVTSPGVRLTTVSTAYNQSPTLGSGTIGGQALLDVAGNYGQYSGVSNNGDVWHQVQRNDANAAVYNMLLNPLGGNVGIGTTGPLEKLEVQGTVYATPIAYAGSQSAYALKMGAYNNTAFDQGIKIKSSSTGQSYMSFNDRSEDALVLRGAKVGIGTDNPGVKLHISDNTGVGIKIERTGTSPSVFTATNASDRMTFDYTSGSGGMYWTIEGTTKMQLAENGNVIIQGTTTATNFILSSDKRLKENIKEVDNKHIDVDWKTFEMKSDKGQSRYGVIAQELEEKHPEFVRTDDEGMKSVAYIDLLIAKIVELEARLEKAGI